MFGDIYFWRQIYILITGFLYSMNVGLMIAFPAVLTPDIISSNNTNIRATPEEATWITASNGLSGICIVMIYPIMQLFGRKVLYITVNLFFLIGWIVFTQANSIMALYAARIIQGLSNGGVYINCIIFCEYSDPRRRGYFITLKKACIPIGVLTCHASSLFCSWRQIAAFSIIPSILAILMTLFWPESPFFLAMKGRFEECEKSFLWLYGTSKTRELNHLISTQKMRLQSRTEENSYKLLLKKDFLRPLAIVSLISLLLDLCGKYYFVVYVIDIMVEVIGDKSAAIYCSLGADVLSVTAYIFSSFLISGFKRRTILFSFGITIVFLMLLISFILLLKSFNIGMNSLWLTPSLIILNSFIVNISIIPVSFTLIGEIFPLEHKSIAACISGVIFSLLYALTMKLTPYLMVSTGVGGTYAIYGCSIAFCLIALYLIVPETKDKPLQQIEDEIKEVSLVNGAETHALL